ncbi:MAG: hypothetical protein R2834_01135 [Rhodothermales bacterium]
MLRRTLLILAGLLVLLATAAIGLLAPYALRTELFEPDPSAGYHAAFFLYVSPEARSKADHGEPLVLLVQPNNSGITSDDPAVHRRDAWWMGLERKRIADELGVALLVPAFIRPATDWQIYTHAIDRDALTTDREDLKRLDLQLIAMIDRARAYLKDAGYDSAERVLIQGFSASGMFANRFTALHPDRVMAAAAGSPGGWPLAPVATWQGEPLNYPAGVADIGKLVGAPFDSTGFAAVPQLLYMGGEDDNDSVDFRDGWDEDAAMQLDRLFGNTPLSRWPHSEVLYHQAGADVRFVLVEGVGHDRKATEDLGLMFFSDVLRQPRP